MANQFITWQDVERDMYGQMQAMLATFKLTERDKKELRGLGLPEWVIGDMSNQATRPDHPLDADSAYDLHSPLLQVPGSKLRGL